MPPRPVVHCQVQNCHLLNTLNCQSCQDNTNSCFYIDCEVEGKCSKLYLQHCREFCKHNKTLRTKA